MGGLHVLIFLELDISCYGSVSTRVPLAPAQNSGCSSFDMCLLPAGISYYWDWQGYTQMTFFIHCDTYVYVYYLMMQTFMLFVTHLASKGPDTQYSTHFC